MMRPKGFSKNSSYFIFFQLVKAPLSCSVKHVFQVFIVVIVISDPGVGVEIPLTQ